MSVIYIAGLQGDSTLLSGGQQLGEVRHAISIYKDEKLDRTLAGGKIWGDPAVLQSLRVGQPATLRTEGGVRLDIQVRRLSHDGAYAYVSVEGPPGF